MVTQAQFNELINLANKAKEAVYAQKYYEFLELLGGPEAATLNSQASQRKQEMINYFLKIRFPDMSNEERNELFGEFELFFGGKFGCPCIDGLDLYINSVSRNSASNLQALVQAFNKEFKTNFEIPTLMKIKQAQNLLNALNKKINKLELEIKNYPNSSKKIIRQAKSSYLQELLKEYQMGMLYKDRPFNLATEGEYAGRVFAATFYSEVKWLADQLSLLSDNDLLRTRKLDVPKYEVMKDLSQSLKNHAKSVYKQYADNPNGIYAKRRLEKYAALTTLVKLYENQQLTMEDFDKIEAKYPKMYDSFFSSTTKKCVDALKQNLRNEIAYCQGTKYFK